MVAQARVTVRNVGWLVAQRGVHVISGVVFAVVVPRLMGPALYGQYALLNSLAAWCVLLGTLGLVQIMGRYVPPLILQSDPASLKKFLGDLLTVRLFSGSLVAALFLVVTALWLRELDWVVLAAVTGAVLARGMAFYFFSLFLGLNQAARWGAEQVIHRWILVILLPLGFVLGGLRGACLGLLLTDASMCMLGLWWSKPYLAWTGLRVDARALAPYLRFGLIFFASNLLATAAQRSGEPLVRLMSGDYRQVGYYGVAYSAFLSAALAISQFTLAFAPLLTALRTQGQTEALSAWIERLLKLLAALGMLAIFGALALRETVVPLVFGKDYHAMAINLVPLALALLPLGLGSVASVIALTYDQPTEALTASVIQLAVFWGLGIPLVSEFKSLGASWAVLIAMLSYASFLTWRMWHVMRPTLSKCAWAVGLGIPFLPLGVVTSSPILNVVMFVFCVIGYGGALVLLRVVTREEINAAWQTIRSRGTAMETGFEQ